MLAFRCHNECDLFLLSDMNPELAKLWHCPRKKCGDSFVPTGKDDQKSCSSELFSHLAMSPRFNHLFLFASCFILQVFGIHWEGSAILQEMAQVFQGEVKPLYIVPHLTCSLPRLTRESRVGEKRPPRESRAGEKRLDPRNQGRQGLPERRKLEVDIIYSVLC